jgi:hypothetical protein
MCVYTHSSLYLVHIETTKTSYILKQREYDPVAKLPSGFDLYHAFDVQTHQQQQAEASLRLARPR